MGEIKIVKRCVFTDMNGVVIRVYEIGDVVEFINKTNYYYLTGMGGIYFDEAEEVTV